MSVIFNFVKQTIKLKEKKNRIQRLKPEELNMVFKMYNKFTMSDSNQYI